jgi:hypothetical protein
MQVANAVARTLARTLAKTKFLFINVWQGGKDFLPPFGGKGFLQLLAWQFGSRPADQRVSSRLLIPENSCQYGQLGQYGQSMSRPVRLRLCVTIFR